MRVSPDWQIVRTMPRGKVRTNGYRALHHQYGFTNAACQRAAIRHKNAGGFADRLGAHETQALATRVYYAVLQYVLGRRGRPRFKSARRGLHSLEGKSNVAGIRWKRRGLSAGFVR